MGLRKEPQQRILDNITIDDNGCWLMKPFKGCKGYAKVEESINGQVKKYRAHRYSYQAFNGEIPNGLQVCHTCDIRNCVNPKHLWLGTNQDNINDMVKKGRQGNRGRPHQTHCPSGHKYTPENTYTPKSTNYSQCRTCWSASNKRNKDKKNFNRRLKRLTLIAHQGFKESTSP